MIRIISIGVAAVAVGFVVAMVAAMNFPGLQKAEYSSAVGYLWMGASGVVGWRFLKLGRA